MNIKRKNNPFSFELKEQLTETFFAKQDIRDIVPTKKFKSDSHAIPGGGSPQSDFQQSIISSNELPNELDRIAQEYQQAFSVEPLSPKQPVIQEKTQPLKKANQSSNIQKPEDIFEGKYTPCSIKFRDKEKNSINNFITMCLNKKQKCRCLLISGLPGSGKTLTTHSILNDSQIRDSFELLSFNGMNYSTQTKFLNHLYRSLFQTQSVASIDDIHEACKSRVRAKPMYSIFFSFLTGIQKLLNFSHLIQQLINIWIKQASSQSNFIIFPNRILLIDEFDNLFQDKEKDILALFDIVNDPKCEISLIGISNTSEMLTSLSRRHHISISQIKSIVFSPYSQKEMYDILQQRLKEMNEQLQLNEPLIDEESLKLCSGKMYSLKGGDIRSLFGICKKIIGINSSKPSRISLPELNNMIDQLYQQNYDFIKSMPTEQQLAILAVFNSFKKDENIIDVPATTVKKQFSDIIKKMALEIDENKIYEILESLQSYQILLLRKKSGATTTSKNNKSTLKINPSKKQQDQTSVFLKIPASEIQRLLGEDESFNWLIA